jgi:RNA polymerase sigma factor (TIGR02999 family)
MAFGFLGWIYFIYFHQDPENGVADLGCCPLLRTKRGWGEGALFAQQSCIWAALYGQLFDSAAACGNSGFVFPSPADTSSTVNEITLILNRAGNGDPKAAEELLPLVYDELRKLASAKMAREPDGHTLQATALVHEAWLRLGGDRQQEWQNRAHFFAAAAESMRRILIDSARRRRAERHGGGLQRFDVDDPAMAIAAPGAADEELLAVHEALDRLAGYDARKAELVKLRYFAGLTIEQAAEVLGVAVPTAKRDWAFSRSWLFKEIGKGRKG